MQKASRAGILAMLAVSAVVSVSDPVAATPPMLETFPLSLPPDGRPSQDARLLILIDSESMGEILSSAIIHFVSVANGPISEAASVGFSPWGPSDVASTLPIRDALDHSHNSEDELHRELQQHTWFVLILVDGYIEALFEARFDPWGSLLALEEAFAATNNRLLADAGAMFQSFLWSPSGVWAIAEDPSAWVETVAARPDEAMALEVTQGVDVVLSTVDWSKNRWENGADSGVHAITGQSLMQDLDRSALAAMSTLGLVEVVGNGYLVILTAVIE